jgi:hypothetical protein
VENRKLIDFDHGKQQLAKVIQQTGAQVAQELNRHHPLVPTGSGKQRGLNGLQFTELQCSVNFGDFATYRVCA